MIISVLVFGTSYIYIQYIYSFNKPTVEDDFLGYFPHHVSVLCVHSDDRAAVSVHRQPFGRTSQVQTRVVQCDALCRCVRGDKPRQRCILPTLMCSTTVNFLHFFGLDICSWEKTQALALFEQFIIYTCFMPYPTSTWNCLLFGSAGRTLVFHVWSEAKCSPRVE